jgi:hypothetical protein
MPRIKIEKALFTDASIIDKHLINQHLVAPDSNASKVIMYTEKRYLWTFLVNGVVDPRYTIPGWANSIGKKQDTAKTVVGSVPANELIDGNSRVYTVFGRIQRASEITAQVGTSTTGTTRAGGFFQLRMKDNYLFPGMNARFYNGLHARVIAHPTGQKGNYVYRFQCSAPGDTFVYATWVGIQPGAKTCFGGFTSYGEKSLRGYGRLHYGEKYINHLTIQRKSIDISGDANARKILWYNFGGEKGFVFEMEAQTRAQFLLEDDYQKSWGVSNMKDSSGNLLASSGMVDEETGEEIVTGDGFVQQISGANDMDTSGTAGAVTWDDLTEMVKAVKVRKNDNTSRLWYVKTGSQGMADIQDVALARFSTSNPLFQEAKGGTDVEVGYNFTVLNILGQKLVFVEDPQQDDAEKFPRRCSDGNLAMSRTMYFIDAGLSQTDGTRNIEILARGREGVNRNLVYLNQNGMTGEGTPTSPVDAMAFHWLKQNNLFVYNVMTNGILAPDANA